MDQWDYVSMSCIVTLSTIWGLYHVYTARKSTVIRDFLVTSRDLGLFPLITSAVATFFSAVGMLGYPAEIYMNGLSFSTISFAILINTPITCFLYLPVFFKLNRMTVFEYLELRFSRVVRICTSLLLTMHTVFYTAIAMYAPALALNQVTGLHLWTSVVTIGIVCVIYTSLGGFRAVVWADVTQCFIMLAITIVIIVKGTIDVGGMGIVWERLQVGKRTEIPIWNTSPHTKYTLWTMIIAYPTYLIGIFSLGQTFMQRYLSNETLRRSQISVIGGGIAIAIVHALISLVGVVMYAYYHDCDPLLDQRITLRDQMVALFAVDSLSFGKGLAGVFVAGVMCATLSTLSSTLNALAAITLSDYVKAFKPDLSDKVSMKLSRILVAFYGVVCIALVALTESIGGIIKALFFITAITGGPTAAIFTVGMLLPWVNSKGALVGFISSMILPMWASIGSFLTSPSPPHHAPISTEGCSNWTSITNATTMTTDKGILHDFYAVESVWYASWSIAVGLITTIVFTTITGGQNPKQVDSDLLFTFMRKYGGNKTGHDQELATLNKADEQHI